jgi:hypothetical protein
MQEAVDDDAAVVVERRRVAAAKVPKNCWRRRRGREHMFLWMFCLGEGYGE